MMRSRAPRPRGPRRATHAARLAAAGIGRVSARAVALLFGAAARIDLLDVCREDTGVMEVGVRDAWLARFLRDHGRTRYLGVATDPPRLAAGWTGPGRRVIHHDDRDGVPGNDAELIVLNGDAGRHFWSYSNYASAHYVAWVPRPGVAALIALLGLARGRLTDRVWVQGVARARDGTGRERTFVLARVRPPATARARRYISPMLGVRGFFEALDGVGARYCVLRWFDSLPEVEEGEDIDLLVDDASLEKVERLLAAEPGTIPVDLYSASGLPGTTYREMAYYPPALAHRLVERAIRTPAGVLAPCPEDHFHSLAYHAVYHKGERSGIPGRGVEAARAGAPALGRGRTPEAEHAGRPGRGHARPPRGDGAGEPDHDYAGVLERLARDCGLDVEITLEGLDAHLEAAGWRPPDDMLVRLAATSAWLRRRLAATTPDSLREWAGLAVFFIRERALELGLEDEIVRRLRTEGFQVLRRRRLDAAAAERVRMRVRGGNWERGPWPVSGGGPAVAIVALDLLPLEPDAEQRRRSPMLDNARALVKASIREAVNEGLPASERCNMLHSSDNHVEAVRYLETALPDEVEAVRAEVAAMRERFRTREPVRATLTRLGRRAKVEVIEYGDGLAVKKTFRPGCERFLEREIAAMRTFGGVLPEIPPLLEAGDGYVVYPYYEAADDPGPHGLLRLDVVRRVLRVVRTLYEHGFALVDLKPSNLILDRRDGLKIVDFEFLHAYRERPASLARCYELAGLPNDYEGDRPDWGGTERGGYAAFWEPRVGIDLDSLLRDPPWLQQLKQWRYRVAHVPIRRLRARRARVRLRVFRLGRRTWALRTRLRRLVSGPPEWARGWGGDASPRA